MSKLKEMFKSLPELGRLNSWPAAMIDRAYLANSKGFFGKAWQFIKVRAIYLTVFMPLTLIDLLVSGAVGARYSFGTFFVADNLQDQRLAQQKKYATIFSKNLYAFLASLIGVGLISPQLVAFYFTPEKNAQKGVTAGGGYHHDEQAELEQPETIEELQSIITDAAESGKKVMPVGAGRSQGKQFLPEGGTGAVVVDLSQLRFPDSAAIHIDRDGVATVNAAVRWADLQNKANEQGLALKFMQASNVFSVGGSIGTDIHGWNITGTLADSILEIEYVDAQGEVRYAGPQNEIFHHLTSGFGLYGVITRVKLQLIKNEKLYERGVAVTPEEYVRHFEQNVQNNENVHMHLYRLSLDPKNLLGSGVAVDYVKDPSPYTRTEEVSSIKGKEKDESIDEQPHRPSKQRERIKEEEKLSRRSKQKERIKGEEELCITPNLQQEGERGTRFNQVMINLARRVPYVRKYYWETERDRVLANDSPATTTNEIMQPPINAMFNPSVSEAEWLQEYFLPGDQLDGFLAELGPLLMANDVPLLNASVRFVKHNKETHLSPLSYARAGDRFAVVLCFNQSLEPNEIIKAKKWLRQAQHMAVTRGGSYYLPYQHVSSPEDFDSAYPDAREEVQELKNRYDRKRVFTNGIYGKYLTPQTETNHFEVIMASQENKNKFAGFLRNVLQRVDADKFFTLLEDIMTYNDTHAEIYQELCNRLPEIMPSAIGDFRHILSSLSNIKTDLARQAQALLPEDLTEINGLVEIGYPGRFVGGFKEHYRVTGSIVAIHENDPSLTDYIQTGYPRPNDDYKKLDYNKPALALAGLDPDSADVITCYVGLHHFPDDKLDDFLVQVRRVLREGGHFLLVDHDIQYGATSMSMAHMAHTVFNAVTGVSLQEELTERRDFRPMSEWMERLEEQGLGYDANGPDVSMIRSGDPSRNRMVSFVKPKLEHQLEVEQRRSAKNDEEHGDGKDHDYREERKIEVRVQEPTASDGTAEKSRGGSGFIVRGQWSSNPSSADLSTDGFLGTGRKQQAFVSSLPHAPTDTTPSFF
jgi:FAD/FMN-containing dehydrogenase/SAM-dependent methyltransferase